MTIFSALAACTLFGLEIAGAISASDFANWEWRFAYEWVSVISATKNALSIISCSPLAFCSQYHPPNGTLMVWRLSMMRTGLKQVWWSRLNFNGSGSCSGASFF